MPGVNVKKVDTGIVTNLPTTNVGWSIGRNVRFKPGAVYKTPGKTLLATVPGALPIRDMFTFKGHDGVFRTIVCCDTKVFSYTNDFTSYTDITPTPAPSSGANDPWQFELIAGMPALSNGVNPMWKWADYGAPLAALANAPTVCRALGKAGNRVLAGNVQEGAYDFPGRVRWPDIAKPEFWDRDRTGRSGKQDLVNPGDGIDAIERVQAIGNQGESALVFTERNVWLGDPAEFPAVLSFHIRLPGVGLVAPRCQVGIKGLNYWMSAEDFHSLSTEKSAVFGFAIWNSVFPNLNKSAIKSAFSFCKPSTKEVFYCVPTGSNSTPDTAFVYQLETKTWAIGDCNYLCHTFAFSETGYSWDTLPFGSWDSIPDSRWDEIGTAGVLPYEVVGDASGRIFKFDDGDNDNGEAISGYIETGDMTMDAPSLNKFLNEVRPSLKPQQTKSILMVQAGARNSLHQDIKWSPPRPFRIGISEKIDCRIMGKYLRLRFYTDQKDSPFILDGYGFKYSAGSTR